MNWNLYVNFLIALLAIINPVSILPMWSELTSDKSNNIRLRVASMLIGFSIVSLTIFLVGGKYILGFFGIDLIVFKVAGGVLLMTTGIKMIEGRNVKLPEKDDGVGTDLQVAKLRFRKIIVPMGIPFIVGPGSITTVFLFGFGLTSMVDIGALIAILVICLIALFFLLTSFFWIERKVDPIVFTAITRLFGIIVTAIAFQFILEGLGEIFPTWVNSSSPIDESIKNASNLKTN
ncbi:MAG: MarC family protein [Bacteroidetes bacterium]|jgi:multiple antibiotic resistance protein|nr:MarC family protein [Bacteroidota bacterium]